MSMKDVYNANNLWDGYLKAREGVEWKESVQKYEANLLLNIYRTRKSIIDGTYTQKPMTEFKLCERGACETDKSTACFRPGCTAFIQ